MTVNVGDQIVQDQKPNDKEYNFAQVRKQLESERLARQQAEQRALEIEKQYQKQSHKEEEDDTDPYVDHKKLDRRLSSFEKEMERKIDEMAERKARAALHQEKQQSWMKSNPDFYDVMQHAQKLYDKDPEFAETILEMPDTFERQKLVYKSIKNMHLHKPQESAPSIQDTINANRKSPYYQPSGVGTAPYASQGDFSKSGQKSAYDKMLELKARLGG